MSKKIYLILFFLFLINVSTEAKINLYVVTKVNEQIITNFDVKKEVQYLKILNPKLLELDEKRIFKLAKNSLINEIIKKNEIKKYTNFDKENLFVKEYLTNLYSSLNYENETDFQNALGSIKGNYSLDEVKEKLKIEILWNELIYVRYNKQIKIDKILFLEKINNLENQNTKEYLLSEIVFERKKNTNLDFQVNQINSSINEIGFNNSANIYSISQTSKLGGKVGWVNENSLSEIIANKLSKLNEKQISEVIQIGNNYLILKIEKIRLKKNLVNKEKELDTMIKFETNKQLNQFSRIFFDKSKINYSINEK
tara:strand:+ start:312 stop:1244 length:933 start_codon:yes stop_codon:yes gene_type:complete